MNTEPDTNVERNKQGTANRYMSPLLSTIFIGAGQLKNGQYLKGLLLSIYQLLVWFVNLKAFSLGFFPAYSFIKRNLLGLVTLGTVPGQDHSLFLMVKGSLALAFVLILLTLRVINIVDAYQNGRTVDRGEQVPDFKESWSNMIEIGFPYFSITPGMIFLSVASIFPILFTIGIAFTNYDLYHSPPGKLLEWIGFENFIDLTTVASWRDTFFSVFGWTVVWAIVSSIGMFVIGLFIAIILNCDRVKGSRIFRTILLIPWAMPAFVSVMIWRYLMNYNFGHINGMVEQVAPLLNKVLVPLSGLINKLFVPLNWLLSVVGSNVILHFDKVGKINWLGDIFWAKIAVLIVNLWLTTPFIVALCSGVLQSIPQNLYEAAKVDGANSWQKFSKITLPLVLRQLIPMLIMQFAFQFNNFGTIYLLTDGGPAVFGQKGRAGATDILISWVYKLTLKVNKYNYAAAISIIIFIIIASISIFQFMKSSSFQEEGY